MPRYIDAEDFERRLEHPPYTIYNSEMFAEWYDECMKSQPTADVQEIRHGHWILEKHLDLDILICSNCGCDRNCTKYGQYYMKHDNYCPNCGAKMDESERISAEAKEDQFVAAGIGQAFNPD